MFHIRISSGPEIKRAAMSENVPSDMCAQIQIRLCIRATWSESSLGAFWIAKDAKFLHVENEDSESDGADTHADLGLRWAE